MIERLADLIVDEGKWLAASMFLGFLGGAVAYRRARRRGFATRLRVLCAMNLFFGIMIGVMAFGHLLAVGVKDVRGTLEGARWALYPMGVLLAVPSWWLVRHAFRGHADDGRWRTTTLWLNGASAASLLVLGLHNLPLALPAALNIGYQLHSARAVGWVIVGTAVVANLGLFVMSLVLLASGQTFEQFRSM